MNKKVTKTDAYVMLFISLTTWAIGYAIVQSGGTPPSYLAPVTLVSGVLFMIIRLIAK